VIKGLLNFKTIGKKEYIQKLIKCWYGFTKVDVSEPAQTLYKELTNGKKL